MNIDWNSKEIIDIIKKAKNYRALRKILSINNPTEVRAICIELGLDAYLGIDRPKEPVEKDKTLRRYTNINLPHTRKYIKDKLKEDPNFIAPKGILLKEDFIEQYYESRKEYDLPIIDSYDFSKLPDIINGRREKVTIFVNEVSTKTGKLIGDWKTCYKSLITNLEDNRMISGMLSKEKTDQYIDTEEFIRRSKEKFPDLNIDYSQVNYINLRTPIILGCPRCGKFFSQMPNEHLYSNTGCCPECAMKICGERKRKPNEEFIQEVIDIYGEDYWDFSKTNYIDSHTQVTLIYKETSEEITRSPGYFLDGLDPKNSVKYKGEELIERILKSKNLSYEKQKHYDQKDIPELVDCRKRINVDFYLDYNNSKFIIEFNGVQHYRFDSFLHRGDYKRFKNQLERDRIVREYCKKNNIILIEIPYTYLDKNKIDNIIDSVILKGEKPENLITIPDII